MRWTRAPSYTSWSSHSHGRSSSASSSSNNSIEDPDDNHSVSEEEDDDDSNSDHGSSAWSTPRQNRLFYSVPSAPPPQSPLPGHERAQERKRVFQTCVYDELAGERELRAHHRATRLRSMVCLALCVFAATTVLVCLGVALRGSPVAQSQAVRLLTAIEESTMVQFTITPRPHIAVKKYGGQHEITTDFGRGFTSIRGQLFPYRSRDQWHSHRLSFDGWIHVQTNTSMSYDIVLSDHRGYRIMRSVPTFGSRSRCLTTRDIPPLHDLHTVATRAFTAQDYASFRVNCTHYKPPVEIIFARMPLVFCPETLATRSFPPLLAANKSTVATTLTTQYVAVHGERMLVEAVLVKSKQEAEDARAARAKMEALEMWGNATDELVAKCPYLEAPLATYKPRAPSLLHSLLNDTGTTPESTEPPPET